MKTVFKRSGPLAPWAVGLIFVAIFGVHFLRVQRIVPLKILLTDRPVTVNNYAQIYARSLREKAFQNVSGRNFGYDPFQSAGYNSNSLILPGTRWSIRTARYLNLLFKPEAAVKVLTWTLFLCLPVFLFASVWLMGWGLPAALLGLMFGVAGFAGFDLYSTSLVYQGKLDFLLGTYLSILTVAIFFRALKKPDKKWMTLHGISLLLLSYVNPVLFMLALVPQCVLGGPEFHGLKKPLRNISGVFLALSVIGMMGVYLRARAAGLYMVPAALSNVGWKDFSSAYLSFFGNGVQLIWVFLRLIFITNSILAVRKLIREKSPLGLAFAAWFGAVFLFIVAGSRIPVFADDQPRQFLLVFSVLQLLFSVYILKDYLVWIHLAPVLVLMSCLLYSSFRGATDPRMLPALPTLSDEKNATLISDLKKIQTQGRILLEDDYSNVTLEEAYPFMTGHAYLGGLGPYAPLRANLETAFIPHPDFREMSFFGSPLSYFNAQTLVGALEAHNVEYIVAISLPARSRFDRYPESFEKIPSSYRLIKSSMGWCSALEYPGGVRNTRSMVPLARIPYQIYRVHGFKPSYLLSGEGQVTLDYDRIIIDQPSKGELILKFHWHPLLRGPENVQIKPVRIVDNSVPIILIDNQSSSNQIVLTSQP